MEDPKSKPDLTRLPAADLVTLIGSETFEADFYREIYCCYQIHDANAMRVLTALAHCPHIPEHLRAMLLVHPEVEIRTAASRKGAAQIKDEVDLRGLDLAGLYPVELSVLLNAGVFNDDAYREIYRIHQGDPFILAYLAKCADLPDDLIEALSMHQNEEVYLSPLALALSTVPVALALEALREGVALKVWQALGLRADVEIFEAMRELVADISDPQEYQDKARALMGSPFLQAGHIETIFSRFKELSGRFRNIEANSKLAEAIYQHPKTTYGIKEELTNAGHEIHPIF